MAFWLRRWRKQSLLRSVRTLNTHRVGVDIEEGGEVKDILEEGGDDKDVLKEGREDVEEGRGVLMGLYGKLFSVF